MTSLLITAIYTTLCYKVKDAVTVWVEFPLKLEFFPGLSFSVTFKIVYITTKIVSNLI